MVTHSTPPLSPDIVTKVDCVVLVVLKISNTVLYSAGNAENFEMIYPRVS